MDSSSSARDDFWGPKGWSSLPPRWREMYSNFRFPARNPALVAPAGHHHARAAAGGVGGEFTIVQLSGPAWRRAKLIQPSCQFAAGGLITATLGTRTLYRPDAPV